MWILLGMFWLCMSVFILMSVLMLVGWMVVGFFKIMLVNFLVMR